MSEFVIGKSKKCGTRGQSLPTMGDRQGGGKALPPVDAGIFTGIDGKKIPATELDDDWMRDGRPKQKADQGDEEAKRELEEMDSPRDLCSSSCSSPVSGFQCQANNYSNLTCSLMHCGRSSGGKVLISFL